MAHAFREVVVYGPRSGGKWARVRDSGRTCSPVRVDGAEAHSAHHSRARTSWFARSPIEIACTRHGNQTRGRVHVVRKMIRKAVVRMRATWQYITSEMTALTGGFLAWTGYNESSV